MKIMYIRDNRRNPVGVIVMKPGKKVTEHHILYGAYYQYSVCNPKDKFTKKLAKQIATARFESEPIFCMGNFDREPSNSHELISLVLLHLHWNTKVKRVRAFTENWFPQSTHRLWDFLRKSSHNDCSSERTRRSTSYLYPEILASKILTYRR
jgi:hypothetical protein